MKNRLTLICGSLFIIFSCFFFTASRCNIRKCSVSADCPGSQICGQAGRCLPRCKTSSDCHQGSRCLEGVCKRIK